MVTTTMRLGLILILALVIIQISKAESDTEEQNKLELGSEENTMASSLEKAQLRSVREAGKNKVGNKGRKKSPKNMKGKKKSRRNKKETGRRSKKSGKSPKKTKDKKKSRQNKKKIGRRSKKSGKGSNGKGKRQKKERKGKNNRRQSKKDLNDKKKKKQSSKKRNGPGKNHRKSNKQNAVVRQGTCDEAKLCQKIKDYIKYSNQLRKVKRIVKSCDTMDKKATKAATEFSATVAALDQVISANAKRQLYIRWRRTKRSTDEVVAIRDNLKNCSASAKAKCEKSVEPACGETAIHTECEAALQAWVTSFGPSKGSCLQASAECCACITALPEVDAKCLDFDAKSTAAVASKKKCVGSSETGSFGFCRKQQQDASVKGPKAACGGSTATKAPGGSTTKAATAANTAAQEDGTCNQGDACKGCGIIDKGYCCADNCNVNGVSITQAGPITLCKCTGSNIISAEDTKAPDTKTTKASEDTKAPDTKTTKAAETGMTQASYSEACNTGDACKGCSINQQSSNGVTTTYCCVDGCKENAVTVSGGVCKCTGPPKPLKPLTFPPFDFGK